MGVLVYVAIGIATGNDNPKENINKFENLEKGESPP